MPRCTHDTSKYLDTLLSFPVLNTFLVSYDKKWAVWSWSNIGSSEQVYFIDLKKGKITPIPNSLENNWVVSLTPDNNSFIVGQDTEGNERVQLFQVKVGDLQTKIRLTESSPKYFLRGGSMHPNNQWLFYGANYDFVKNEEIEPTLIYRHDLKTGEKKLLAHPIKSVYTEPEINMQGTHLLYTRSDLNSAGTQIWMVDIKGNVDREILNFGSNKKVFASWLPDGKRIIFVAEKENYRSVGLLELATNKTTWLVDDPERNIENAFVPYGSKYAVIVEEKEAITKASFLNLETLKEIYFPRFKGDLVPISPVNNTWLGVYSDSKSPLDLVRFDLKVINPEKFVSITKLWEQVPVRPEALTQAKNFKWKSVDNLEIQGWLYKAKTPAKGTIILVHWGPTCHSKNQFNPQIQYFVSKGFNVLDPNYRGSTGFGLEFQELIKKTYWGGLEQEDIRTGIEALIEKGIAKKGKVGITGTSYGGYSSWFAITHFPREIVAAAAPICGMVDLIKDYESTRPDLRPYSEEMLGGSPHDVSERYKERSPINFLENIEGELLIIQGMRDPNVTPHIIKDVEVKLKKYSINYEKLIFKNEGHGIARLKNKKILYKRLVDFFELAFK